MTKIEVQGAIVSELPDGVRVLEISSRNGQYKLEFSPTQWALLADTAKWFRDEAAKTQGLNGKSEDESVAKTEEEN